MNRPECPLVSARLPALIEDDLSTGEAELVRAHLEGCAQCARESTALTRLRGALRAGPPPAPEFAAATARLRLALRAEARPRGWPARPLLAAAAALLLTALGWRFLPAPRVSIAEICRASAGAASSFVPLRVGLPGVDLELHRSGDLR